MRYFSAIILIFLILNSCDSGKKGLDISIRNNKPQTIYDVSISVGSDSEITFDSIPPNQIRMKYLDMNDIGRVDGSYLLKYTTSDGKTSKSSFGYFTNGAPTNYKICCSISDGIISTLFDDLCK